MKTSDCERDLLGGLSRMPLMDRLEMVAITGWSRGAVYEAVQRLEEAGLVAPVLHATDLIPQTGRYHLTAAGIELLAEGEGIGVGELLRARPVSAQWQRLLLARLDGVATIYRLASAMSNVSSGLRVRWYRAAPMDAAIELADGRVVYVVRQGRAPDRTSFAKRIWRLWDAPQAGLVLLLAPDAVRLRRTLLLLSEGPVPALAALEGDVVRAGPRDPVWRWPSGGAPVDLPSALERAQHGGPPAAEQELSRVSPPAEAQGTPDDCELPDHALPTVLSPAEKRALDAIFDWPWISRGDLAGLVGVSASRASRIVASLRGFGLVVAVPDGRRRLALTDRGLGVAARRDRTAFGVARRRWSAAYLDPRKPYTWRNVTGTRSRQLLRNIEHTDAVHGFLAALCRQARSSGWDVKQLDPPGGASRYFRFGGTLRSVNPDAFGVLRNGGVTWPFFLEWERRAVRPGTMTGRIAPYIRYFSTRQPLDDHGLLPAVLVVFHDELAAARFLQVACNEMQRTRVEVPLLVSDRVAVGRLGPLGPGWKSAAGWESRSALPTG